MKVNDCKVRFQLDTSADVNTITQRFVCRHQVRQSKGKVVMWNGSRMIPKGVLALASCDKLEDWRNLRRIIMIRDRKKTMLNAIDGKGKCAPTKVGVKGALNYQTDCKRELGMAILKTVLACCQRYC